MNQVHLATMETKQLAQLIDEWFSYWLRNNYFIIYDQNLKTLGTLKDILGFLPQFFQSIMITLSKFQGFLVRSLSEYLEWIPLLHHYH